MAAPSPTIREFDRNKAGVDFRYRLCFLGDTNTGKTEMFCRAMTGQAPKYKQPTIAVDFKEHSWPIDKGSNAKVMVWDTPGDAIDVNRGLNHCVRMSIVFVLYDPAKRESFLHVPKWHQEVAGKNPDTVFVLVAGKQDLVKQGKINSVVTTEEATEKAETLGMRFMELDLTSTPEVVPVFRNLISECHARANAGTILWEMPLAERVPQTTSKTTNKQRSAGCSCFGLCP